MEDLYLQKQFLISECSSSECHMYLGNIDKTTNRRIVPSVSIKQEVASFW